MRQPGAGEPQAAGEVRRSDPALDTEDALGRDLDFRHHGSARKASVAKRAGEFAVGFLCVLLYLFFFDPRSSDTLIVLKAFLRIGQYINLTVHAVIIMSCVSGLVVCLLHHRRWVRMVSFTLFVVFSACGVGFHAVFHSNVQVTDLGVLLSGQNFVGDALISYAGAYFRAMALALGAGLGLLLLPKLLRLRCATWALAVPGAAMLATWLVLYETAGVFGFVPTAYALPGLVLFSLADPLYRGPREPPAVRSTEPRQAKHVMLIMDESVRGDMLSVNGYRVETTPYLSSLSDTLVNLGVASSASNCSEYTHLIVRTGLRADQIPDVAQRSLRKPDLAQFARNAGFRAYFIDGQWRQGKLHSFMRRADLEHLDGFFQTEGVECEASGDCEVADRIVEIITGDERSFIYAVKKGVHVHYENSYPQSQRVFAPTLTVFEPLRDRERALNSYYNGIRWNVDRFFQTLLPRIANRDYILVYTSDHGQHILETASPLTHCQADRPAPSQAAVPMLMAAGRPETRRILEGMVKRKQRRATHFEIFPTLLVLFGYEREFVYREYGATLFDPPGVRRFYSGDVFGRRSGGGWMLSDGKLLGQGESGDWTIFDPPRVGE